MRQRYWRLLLARWQLYARRAADSHYREARINHRWNSVFIVINTIFSITVLGFSLSDQKIREYLGTLGTLISAVIIPFLSGLVVLSGVAQALMDPSGRALIFKQAGEEYAALIRKLGQMIDEEADADRLTQVRHELDKLARMAPLISSRMMRDKELSRMLAEADKYSNEFIKSQAEDGES